MVTIRLFGRTDTGLKRGNNEDIFALHPDPGIALVADGMGGAASGEVASGIFAATASDVFPAGTTLSEREALEKVQRAFLLANDRITAAVRENPVHKGMGCTAELIAFCGESYVLGHVGDSRTYLFRHGQLRQLTRDHSLVQEQVDKGVLTPVEAKTHAFRNVILRAVGVGETLAVDLVRGKVLPGDLFLLCSDGLSDMADDAAVADILSLGLAADRKVDRLIDAALAAGGLDNVTIVLCEAVPSP
jgi:PPM family protein phosphatase